MINHNNEISIDKEKLNYVREYLIEEVFRNSSVMHSDQCRGLEYDTPDLIEIIACLYEYLHILLEGEPYAYFFHWANKCESWVEEGNFDNIINKRMVKDGYERKKD